MNRDRWDRIESVAERGWQIQGLRLALIGATALAGAAVAGLVLRWPGVGYAALAGAVLGLFARLAAKRKG